ncbi:hypothetical protein C3L33_14928, partial [Rhododendron williamsianum]
MSQGGISDVLRKRDQYVGEWRAPISNLTALSEISSPVASFAQAGSFRLVFNPTDGLVCVRILFSEKFDVHSCLYVNVTIVNQDESKSVSRHWCDERVEEISFPSFLSSVELIDLGFVSGSVLVRFDMRVLLDDLEQEKRDSESPSFIWNIKNLKLFKDVVQKHKIFSGPFSIEEGLTVRATMHHLAIGHLAIGVECMEMQKENGAWIFLKLSVDKKYKNRSWVTNAWGRISQRSDEIVFNNLTENSGLQMDALSLCLSCLRAREEFSLVRQHGCSYGKQWMLLMKGKETYAAHIRWLIQNFSRLKEVLEKEENGVAVKSSSFQLGEKMFHLAIYPEGLSPPSGHLSFYLDVEHSHDSYDSSWLVAFELSIVRPKLAAEPFVKKSLVRFSNSRKDIGWPDFVAHKDFYRDDGCLGEDGVQFRAKIFILKEKFLSQDAKTLGKLGISLSQDKNLGFHIWKIQNFSTFKPLWDFEKIISQAFQARGYELQIGVWLTSTDVWASLELHSPLLGDRDLTCLISSSIILVNQENPDRCVKREFTISSNGRNDDKLMELEVLKSNNGFLLNETVIFVCEIIDFQVLSASSNELQENVPDNIPESIVVMEAGPSKERYAVLAKRLSLSEDSRIQHLGKRIYAALLESSTDESFNEKRMLKELLEIATGHTNDSEQASKLSDILVCFAGEVPKVARLIVQMAIDDSRKAKGDQANLRSQLEEKAVLSKRLEENSKELKLKMEKVESKLMSEKQLYKEDLHRKNEEYKKALRKKEDAIKQLKNGMEEQSNKYAIEKDALGEKLKRIEGGKKISDQEIKKLKDVIRQLREEKANLEAEFQAFRTQETLGLFRFIASVLKIVCRRSH